MDYQREQDFKNKYQQPIDEKIVRCMVCNKPTTEFAVVELGHPCDSCVKIAHAEYKDNFPIWESESL